MSADSVKKQVKEVSETDKEKEDREKLMKDIHKTAWETYQKEKYGEVMKEPDDKKQENNSTSTSSSTSRRSVSSSLNEGEA